MSNLTLRVLGPFQAALGDRPLTEFRTNKVRALLIYLAIEDRPVTREALMALLWPGLPERSARANLRAAMANEEKAEKDAKRQQRMHSEDPGTISVRRLEASQATWEQAQAKTASAEAEIQLAIEQMGGEG